MKLNAIKKCCLEMGIFYVLRDEWGGCWISNTRACWPTDGMEIGEKNIQALFDLKPKKMRTLMIREAVISKTWLCLEPLPGDIELKICGYVYDTGDLYAVLEDKQGFIRMINSTWLGPAGDIELRFFLRVGDDGVERIVAFGDLLVAAIVETVESKKAEEVMKKMRALAGAPLAVIRETDVERA